MQIGKHALFLTCQRLLNCGDKGSLGLLTICYANINIYYVTESGKTVPNHTFLFHYIYYCNI